MNISSRFPNQLIIAVALLALITTFQSCSQGESAVLNESQQTIAKEVDKPEYYSLRPEVEKGFGYSHAVKIGNTIKVSGAVSMDDQGNPTAIGDMGQQMKNIYASLETILTHFDCTFDDVVVENIFTTNMPLFLENAAYRRTIYTKNFPTGTWLGVKELAIPVFMIEIELEVYKSE